MKSLFSLFILGCSLLAATTQVAAQQTETMYLSGTDKDNTVDWDFYCTSGRNSGKWTTIPVPSNWELQGFGKYNYGHDKDSTRGKEKGLYKYSFRVPQDWKGKKVNIVFEGSMTDTKVMVNGQSAGALHQGSFYAFKYDISSLLKYGGSNLLEVTVAKHSTNDSVNWAERHGDFWIFGGVYRPVFLEALPEQQINRIALDAKGNGQFTADVFLGGISNADEVSAQVYSLDGERIGSPFTSSINSGENTVRLAATIGGIKQWSPEFPNLYHVVFTLREGGKAIHKVKERFGFRTVELRERDGIYVNGVKVKFRGVNHHSFWPSSGRTTSKKLSIEDVELMKDMNMNAVRMSHYPPDAHLLDVCDSLGLFVMDELCGWHWHYDTKTGTQLTQEMLEHDMNHASVILWSNGNEGGHNWDLDPVFDRIDNLQHRPLVHPWEVFRGMDTQHYINFDYGNGTHLHGHNIVFPTEFLHGLYDGGHGAGLEDYWEQMWYYPLSAGGFLWVFADEGVERADKKDSIDTHGDHAPDGIVGPYHEKEGSYFTIKRVWSPVFIEKREITPAFDGNFRVENRFFFTNLNQCSFSWKLERTATPDGETMALVKTGTASIGDVKPTEFGTLSLSLPSDWKNFHVLSVTATDPHGKKICTWTWPIAKPQTVAELLIVKNGEGAVKVTETDSLYHVTANGIRVSFNRNNGRLQQVRNENGVIPFGNGPVLAEGTTDFQKLTYRTEGKNVVVESSFGKSSSYRSLVWTVYPSGWVQMEAKYFPADYETTLIGLSFSYPEKDVKSVRWMGDGPYRVWKNRTQGPTLGVWKKKYNNTATGVDFDYPEFKGYYSNLYWMRLNTATQPITIVCANEDVFLRLYTPKQPAKVYNTAPEFPSGDISFMHGIPAIGTKSQKAENTGPAGRKNMYYDYSKDKAYAKELNLFFDFSGN